MWHRNRNKYSGSGTGREACPGTVTFATLRSVLVADTSRDVKLDNIFLAWDEEKKQEVLKLGDFGAPARRPCPQCLRLRCAVDLCQSLSLSQSLCPIVSVAHLAKGFSEPWHEGLCFTNSVGTLHYAAPGT